MSLNTNGTIKQEQENRETYKSRNFTYASDLAQSKWDLVLHALGIHKSRNLYTSSRIGML
jgi:hypothetical protein